MRRDDRFRTRRLLSLEPGQGPDDGQVGQAGDVLADGGEVDVGQPGQAAVVEADDGDLSGNTDADPEEHVEDAGRALVVEGQHGGRPGRGGEQAAGGGGAVLLRQAARHDLAGQAVPAHGGAVAPAPVGGPGGPAAVDVDDVTVAEGHQVIHGLAGAVVVRGPHHV